MAQLSPVVSLYNLNQVYTELNNRIESLNKIWTVKGTCTWAQLKTKTDAAANDVWNVSDTDDWGIEGGNWAFTTTQPSSAINYITVASGKYWYRLGGILEYASPNAAGVAKVFTPTSTTDGTAASSANGNSAANTGTGLLTRGVYTENNTLYTTLPIASLNTYGVITVGAQSFNGEKTFNNGVIVNGTISTPAGSTAALSVTGGTAAGSLNTGTLSVTNDLAVIGNNPAGGSVATTGTLAVNGQLTVSDNTSAAARTGTLTVTNNTNVQNNLTTKNLDITSANSKFTVSNNTASAASTGTLAAASTMVQGTLTTKNLDITQANSKLTVSGNSATAATTDLLTVHNTSNNASLTVLNDLQTQNMTVNQNTTAGSLSADSIQATNIVYTQNLTAANIYGPTVNDPIPTVNLTGTVSAQNLKMSSDGTTINKDLTVTNNASVTTLTAPIATVGAELKVNILDIQNGTLAVTNNGSTTVNTLQVRTNINAATSTNLLTLGNTFTSGNGGVFANTLNDTNNPVRLDGTASMPGPSLLVYGGGYFTGGVQATKVFNAVWNDISDRIEIDIKPTPGYAYAMKDGHYTKTSKYMDQGYIGIESDTSGFEMGGKNAKYELNVAVAGFVLAYVDKEYKPGTPLTVTKDGKLTKIRLLGRIFHPEMVVATFWKPEPKLTFGPEGGEKLVNKRMWVKIK